MRRQSLVTGAVGALAGLLAPTTRGTTMSADTDLRDAAVTALQKTTVSYPEWVKRRDAGRYADITATEWWKAFDALAKIGTGEPPPPPPPPPPPSDAPVRATTVTGQSGLTAQNDTRYIDCPGLSIPNGLARCTIIGSQFPTTQLRGMQDVWIEGRPDAYMNAGPRSDGGDLVQIKVNPSGYAPCDKLVLRWIRFHDATRPAGSTAHTDGIQIMALTNSHLVDLEVLDNFQGIQMATNMNPAQGFGPITGNLFERISFRERPESPWAANFGAGTGTDITRNTVKDLVCLDGASILIRAGWVANGNLIDNCPCAKIE